MCYRQQALCNRRKKQGGTCIANVYRHGPCLCLLSSSTPLSTVQTLVQCNDNSTRSYENQSVVFCTQNCSKLVKTAFKHCLTVKLLKSKVTLCNTCEKLKIDVTLGKVKGQ